MHHPPSHRRHIPQRSQSAPFKTILVLGLAFALILWAVLTVPNLIAADSIIAVSPDPSAPGQPGQLSLPELGIVNGRYEPGRTIGSQQLQAGFVPAPPQPVEWYNDTLRVEYEADLAEWEKKHPPSPLRERTLFGDRPVLSYFTAATRKATYEFGLREDGVVVWRKVEGKNLTK